LLATQLPAIWAFELLAIIMFFRFALVGIASLPSTRIAGSLAKPISAIVYRATAELPSSASTMTLLPDCRFARLP
jgi:hypothetical protein